MRSSVKILTIIAAVLIITLGTIFGMLVIEQGKPLPLVGSIVTVPLLEQSPEKVIQMMWRRMVTVQTARYEADITVRFNTEKGPVIIKTTLIFTGGLNEAPIGQLTAASDITLQNLQYVARGELRATAEKNYFRLSEVPAIPFVDLANIQNKWYEFEPQLMNDHYRRIITAWQEVQQRGSFLTAIKRLPDEVRNHQRTYHYQAMFDTRALSDTQPALIPKGWPTTVPLELWIAKKGGYLDQLTATLQDGQREIAISLVISHYNESVTIDEPSEKYSLATFARELFGQTNFLDLPLFGYLVGLPTNSLVTDSDGDGLYVFWEKQFGTDDTKPDTDGDGYQDGEEVTHGYNPNGPGPLWATHRSGP